VLVIVTDVTDELERQRAERDQQKLTALFTRARIRASHRICPD
jgi:hypothetical protein